MLHRVFPLRSLSAALVLSTSFTVPAFAVYYDVTHPQGPLTGPIIETNPVNIFHSSATVTSTDYGFRFDAGVDTAILFSSSSIVSSYDAFYVSAGDVGSIANYGTITSDRDGVSVQSVTGSFYNAGTIMGLDTTHGKTVDLDGGVTGTFENAGSIYGANRAIDFDAHVATFINSGDIEADAVFDTGYHFGSGIDANTIGTFSNSGTIYSPGRTIQATGITSFTNSGTIKAVGTGGGEAVYVSGNVGSFANSGTIEARNAEAIYVSGDVGSFTNSGTISANSNNKYALSIAGTVGELRNEKDGVISSAYGGALLSGAVTSFFNAGKITAADAAGVEFGSTVGAFTNIGTIESDNDALSFGGNVGTFNNTGSITSLGDGGVYIAGSVTGSFINGPGGRITGANHGVVINGSAASFINNGTISTSGTGATAVRIGQALTGTFTNTGTIEASDGFGVSIRAGRLVNTGTIRGVTGINSDLLLTATTIVNSGTIEGTGGTAFYLGDETVDDTVEVLTGSLILGTMDFSHGNDTLDISGFRGSTVMTVARLETVVSGNALVNDQRDGAGSGTISVVDATAIRSGGATVMGEVAGAIGGEIAGALGGITGGAGPVEPLGYAPSRPVGAAEAAADELIATAEPTRPEVWGKVFGGIANKSTDYSAVLGGIIAGSHVAVDADTHLGGVVGVSGSRFVTAGGGQEIGSTIGSAGLYGSTDLGEVTLSYSVLAGVSANHSERTVTAAITETARADFASWYWSPELGLSIPVPLLEGVDTAAGFKLRYIGGGTGSYTETGSSQNLSVGTSAVNLLDARVELTGTTQVAANDFGEVMLSATGGLLAQHNFGSSVAVAGFPLATTPAAFAYGAYGDLTLDAPIGPASSISASAGLELRSDGASSASTNLGLSATF